LCLSVVGGGGEVGGLFVCGGGGGGGCGMATRRLYIICFISIIVIKT